MRWGLQLRDQNAVAAAAARRGGTFWVSPVQGSPPPAARSLFDGCLHFKLRESARMISCPLRFIACELLR